MSRILIKGGRVVDPAAGRAQNADLRIEKGRIVESFSRETGVEVIEAKGLIVAPGLIDMHVHLREPGREDEETIDSGARAAAAGGFTTIVCMPNTQPAIDNRSVVDYIAERSAQSVIDVLVAGAITKGLRGERLADMGELVEAGVVGFSDDGLPVADSALMRRAMEYSLVFDRPIISHAEDLRLSAGGVMHEGVVSTQLGLKGIPAGAEEVQVARDIMIAEMTGARLHITHVSTAGSVEMIRGAKARGVRVTADVTPHHLVLTDTQLTGYDTNFKINPPLRTEEDKVALVAGLMDDTLDAIASDHAPHAAQEKELEIEDAPCGTIGLQTTLPVVLTHLVGGQLDLVKLIEKLSVGPAGVLGVDKGTLAVGAQADVTVIDTKAKVKVDTDYIISKSANSAWIGEDLKGVALHVLAAGKVIVRQGKLVN